MIFPNYICACVSCLRGFISPSEYRVYAVTFFFFLFVQIKFFLCDTMLTISKVNTAVDSFSSGIISQRKSTGAALGRIRSPGNFGDLEMAPVRGTGRQTHLPVDRMDPDARHRTTGISSSHGTTRNWNRLESYIAPVRISCDRTTKGGSSC